MHSGRSLLYLIPFTFVSVIGSVFVLVTLTCWRKQIEFTNSLYYGFCWILCCDIMSLTQYLAFQLFTYFQVNIQMDPKIMEIICYFWTFYIHLEIVLPLYIHCVLLFEQFTGWLSTNLRNERIRIVSVFIIFTSVIISVQIFSILYQRAVNIVSCILDPITIKMVSLVQLVWWFTLPGAGISAFTLFITMKLVFNRLQHIRIKNQELLNSLLLIMMSIVKLTSCVPILIIHNNMKTRTITASSTKVSEVCNFLFRIGGYLNWLLIFILVKRLRSELWTAMTASCREKLEKKIVKQTDASGDMPINYDEIVM